MTDRSDRIERRQTGSDGFPTAEEWDEQWEQAKKDKIKEWGGVPNEELWELIEEFRNEAKNHGLMTNDPEAKEAFELCADQLEELIDE